MSDSQPPNELMSTLAIIGLFAIVIWFFSDSDGHAPDGGTFIWRAFVVFAVVLILSMFSDLKKK